MSWYTGTATYVIIWGLVMFMVLPWGVRRIEPGDLGEGDDPGAPKKTHLWLKAVITTVAASIIYGLVYLVVVSGVISFRT